MPKVLHVLLGGFLVWLIPFAVATPLLGVREANRPLFESIMPVVLAATTALCALGFLGRFRASPLRDGVGIGLAWAAISIAIDLPLFVGVFGMGLADYAQDIALTYLIIPIVTVATGLAFGRGGAQAAL
jgi:hypothetical protein